MKLDLSNMKLAVYYDVSFANLKDGGSQGGFITFFFMMEFKTVVQLHGHPNT